MKRKVGLILFRRVESLTCQFLIDYWRVNCGYARKITEAYVSLTQSDFSEGSTTLLQYFDKISLDYVCDIQ